MKLRQTTLIREAVADFESRGGIKNPSKYGSEWIEHKFLIELAQNMNRSLPRLVRGSQVYFEPKSAPKKTQEYLDLMAKLRIEQQENDYQELIGNKEEPTIIKPGSMDAKAAKEEVTTVINIMISVFAVAWAIWKWTGHWSVQGRTLACLFGAILILVAEVVVYCGYRRRVNEAREDAKNLKEKRKVVETWSIDSVEPETTKPTDAARTESTASTASTGIDESPAGVRKRR